MDANSNKYAIITDMIYKAVFREKAKEYKKLLSLSEKDNLRRTLYAEVLKAVWIPSPW